MKKNDISVTPVKKYTPPKYPTIEDAKSNPDLLRKLPSRWQKKAKIFATVGMIGTMTFTSHTLPPDRNSTNTGVLGGYIAAKIPSEHDNANMITDVFITDEKWSTGLISENTMEIPPDDETTEMIEETEN